MKRILIDGRFIGVGESMTRYTLEVLGGILKLDKENEYSLLVRPVGVNVARKWLEAYNLQPTTYKLKVLDIPHYSVAEQTKLLSYLNSENYDLVHFIQFNHPVRYKRSFVVTVHDLILLHHFEGNVLKKMAFKLVLRSAVKGSKEIITISEATKHSLIQDLQADPDKITVTYLGVDHSKYSVEARGERREVEEIKEKYQIDGPYILYTGAWKKHKNLIGLLKAYEQFLSSQYESIGEHKNETMEQLSNRLPKLVLAGKIDPNEPEVLAEINRINHSLKSNFELLTSIIVAGFIEENDLPFLYAGALAYVIPSLEEGFGLPPLEAMACGTPVLSSKASCIPEILGNAALYFDPKNVDSISKALEKIVSDEKLRADLTKRGVEQSNKYSWEKTAKETLEAYKRVLQS